VGAIAPARPTERAHGRRNDRRADDAAVRSRGNRRVAAIKKALCREAGLDRDWLGKVRPWSGHDYHFHVRIFCPPDSPQCKPQPPPEPGDGCGHELDYWFSNAALHPAPSLQPAKPGPPLTLAELPAACRAVLMAP
jgi:penicillin-insensitive murein endopeptidase